MNRNLNKNGDLNPVALFLTGGALFSMHFGASSMVWPMNWGKESGASWPLAFVGAFITAVLLVLFAYLALAKSGISFNEMAMRTTGKSFGRFYTCLTIAVMGPLYAIPRMSAAAWDSIVQAFGLTDVGRVPLVIFTIIFYIVTYFFLANPGKAMDRISAMLFPILLVVVVLVVGKSLLNPIAEPVVQSYEQNAFTYGFTNGYATAELPCALVFGVVILKSLENKGVMSSKMNKNMIRVGLAGLSMLTVTHLCHMIIGAYTGGTLDLTYTALYTAVAIAQYGQVGGYLFSLALFMAALTTAIGMASGSAEFFVEVSHNKLDYKKWAAIICVVSVFFGSLGLTDMLSLLSPILDGVYPPAIVLVLFFAFCPDANKPRRIFACGVSTIVAFACGMFDMIYKYMVQFDVNPGGIRDLYLKIPFSDVSMAWVPFAIVAFVVGWLAYRDSSSAQSVSETVDTQS